MKILEPGHIYELEHLDGSDVECLTFVNRGHGKDHEGTNNQEVLRVLIDRVKFLNNELNWQGNEQILFHLRMALVLHETRHLERLLERGKLNPEEVSVGKDGHFIYENSEYHNMLLDAIIDYMNNDVDIPNGKDNVSDALFKMKI